MGRRRSSLKNIVGPAVQKRRVELGWSQAKLATECQLVGWDISRGIVAALESRVRWAGDYEVALLARVMGVTIESFFTDTINWREVGLSDIQLPKKRTGG